MAEATAEQPIAAARPFDSFLTLEFGKQLGLMLGLAASVAVGIGLVLWLVVEKDYKPLTSGIQTTDVAAVMDLLDQSAIDYRLDHNTGAILVDAAKIQQARVKLAAAGFQMDKNLGYELLEKDQPLGTSQFMENARYRRSLEGELARTISSISGVRSARVHLAIPKSTVFLREKREPKASVFVEAFQGFGRDRTQVRAIANLVVTAVPELKIENVTVVDQRGNQLSNFADDPKYLEAAKQIEYTRKVESDYLARVNSLLEPILGAELFRAEVSVELDFTEREQTAEIYNPDLPAIRSEQMSTEVSAGDTNVGGVPGAAANSPENAEGVENEGAESTQSRSRTTKNYELDRTISHTKQQMGQIKRLTVAVAVDHLLQEVESIANEEEADEESVEPIMESVPWEQADLDRLVALVQDSVGYNALRGDRVTVINTPFMRETFSYDPPPPLELWEESWFWPAVKAALGVLGFLMVVFLIFRPALKRLTDNSKAVNELEAKHRQAIDQLNAAIAESGSSAQVDENGEVTFSPGTNPLLPPPEDRLGEQIDMVKQVIDDDPDRVVQVINDWTSDDG